jgi:hypothetical protein
MGSNNSVLACMVTIFGVRMSKSSEKALAKFFDFILDEYPEHAATAAAALSLPKRNVVPPPVRPPKKKRRK